MMRIMGVDPGLTRCGVGIIDAGNSRAVKFVAVETINSDKSDTIDVRIGTIAERLESMISEYRPQRLAIERVFSQQNLRSVMGTAQISGVVFYLANKHGIPVEFATLGGTAQPLLDPQQVLKPPGNPRLRNPEPRSEAS